MNTIKHMLGCIKPGQSETVGSRAGHGWDRWRQWQLSTTKTRSDWRSTRPVVLDVPSAAIFSLRRARAAQLLTCNFVEGGAMRAVCGRRECPFLLSCLTAWPAKRCVSFSFSLFFGKEREQDEEENGRGRERERERERKGFQAAKLKNRFRFRWT